MEEELPLKIIELSDFLRSPSILSKKLEFKKGPSEQLPADQQLKDAQKTDTMDENHSDQQYSKLDELTVSKDVIVFADDLDRKKLGLFNKSKNCFSRHLLITSDTALETLIPTLTNVKEWIIFCKLQYSRLHTKKSPIERDVLIALNLNHPVVRYEILTAFDLLQQSFNEIKTAFILIDFSQILTRWFKNYLQRTGQYPSLSRRIIYRHQILKCKCSITLGKRSYYLEKAASGFKTSLHKLRHKSSVPLQIHVDFNSLPTMVYSIELNNVFVYSLNDEYKKILKDIGNGLSLVSVQNLIVPENPTKKTNEHPSDGQKEEMFQGKYSVQEEEETHLCPIPYEPNEQDQILFEKLWNNRMRIQVQHRQLMMKAAHLLGFSSMVNDPTFGTSLQANKEQEMQANKLFPY